VIPEALDNGIDKLRRETAGGTCQAVKASIELACEIVEISRSSRKTIISLSRLQATLVSGFRPSFTTLSSTVAFYVMFRQFTYEIVRGAVHIIKGFEKGEVFL
jgi:hypothetical protein